MRLPRMALPRSFLNQCGQTGLCHGVERFLEVKLDYPEVASGV